MRCLFAVCLFAPAFALAQGVYRCPGPNGQPVYQQAPCTGGASVNVTQGNVMQAYRAPEPAPPEEIGMNDKQLRAKYGNPIMINTDFENGVRREQYVFSGPGGHTFVDMKDGKAYAVSHRDKTATPQGPCFTEKQIWNASVSANSQSHSPARRDSLQREVQRMERQRCR